MLILPNIRSALEQLWANKMRSVLTVLGIVIAVASTITVVSVVRGFTAYVADFLQGLGTNAMWVWSERPGGEAGKRLGRIELDLDDVEAVERQCSALQWVSPLIRRPRREPRPGEAGGDGTPGGGRGVVPRHPQLPRRGRPAVRRRRRRTRAPRLRPGARGAAQARRR
jgi:hypothetical protein